jgi:hypothetical protein
MVAATPSAPVLEQVNEALSGLLDVSVTDNCLTVSESVNLVDGLYKWPPVSYCPEFCELLEDHDGDIGKAVVAHLQWVVAEHQKNLQAVTDRLRVRGLIA